MQLLEPLKSPEVSDLVYNGHLHGFVYLRGSWQAVEPLASEAELANAARELCARGGRHIDLASPFADVSVEGMRVHALIAAGVSDRTYLSIRKHSNRVVPLEPRLQQLVHDRANFLVTGATGAGKTTLLRSMLSGLDQRIVTIEDVAELELTSPMAASLVSRQSNVEGRGGIGLEELFRQALRMRPERIALGEVRGTEFALMLQALNTGHAGSAATLHANSIDAVASRVIGLGLLAGLSAEATKLLASTAIDYVIHLGSDGVQIKRLSELFA